MALVASTWLFDPLSDRRHTAVPSFDDIPVGFAIGPREIAVTRADLVRYAGASGDFNPIHWSDRYARMGGLPQVIMQGALTMGLANRVLTDWLGDPGAVLETSVRCRDAVFVPDDDDDDDDDAGARIVVAAVVAAQLPQRRVRVDFTVTSEGVKVLSHAKAVVQLV
ncbi:MaoC/PaaZ C-terminal domain-containing protein [Nocardia sp. CA-120079]|uniref:MaoC/PaaZ C-terminal domain-containing protein n=1 Tax=Nocardia sp. CA-120079 TaxID=3239974 RepID=UPI003D9745B7